MEYLGLDEDDADLYNSQIKHDKNSLSKVPLI